MAIKPIGDCNMFESKIIVNINKIADLILKEWSEDKIRYSSYDEGLSESEFKMFIKDFCFDYEISKHDSERIFRLHKILDEFNSLGVVKK